jgi:hypothetical protein
LNDATRLVKNGARDLLDTLRLVKDGARDLLKRKEQMTQEEKNLALIIKETANRMNETTFILLSPQQLNELFRCSGFEQVLPCGFDL